jgi:hypothetical protein
MRLRIKWVLICWASVATVVAALALWRYLDDAGFEFGPIKDVDYYEIPDLRRLNLPSWNQTNTLPLSPELAVKLGLAEVQRRHPSDGEWALKHLELERQYDDVWAYNLTFTQRTGLGHDVIRVLMSGEVWQPKKQYDK